MEMPFASNIEKKGDLSLDQYDDSQHSRHSIGTMGGAFSAISAAGAVGGMSGMRFPSPAPPQAPWGSGLGGVGKNGLDAHVVVPGGIWLPTPRATMTQGIGTFSPGSSAGAGGRGGAGGGSEANAQDGEGRRGAGDDRGGGFFGSEEPKCDRCGTTSAMERPQVMHLALAGFVLEKIIYTLLGRRGEEGVTLWFMQLSIQYQSISFPPVFKYFHTYSLFFTGMFLVQGIQIRPTYIANCRSCEALPDQFQHHAKAKFQGPKAPAGHVLELFVGCFSISYPRPTRCFIFFLSR